MICYLDSTYLYLVELGILIISEICHFLLEPLDLGLTSLLPVLGGGNHATSGF